MLPQVFAVCRIVSRQHCIRAASSVSGASILTKLAPEPRSVINSIRVGRGPGNKKGKTAGRGQKGHNSRSGGGDAYYEGGQTPIHIRFPKVGDKSSRRLKMLPVNLDTIQEAIETRRIDPNKPITLKTLKEARIVNKLGDGIKLLSRGAEVLTYPITIYVTRASLEAIRQVEAKGGKVTTVYYNKLGMEYLINPQKFGTTRRVPRLALPLRRYLIEYYSNPMKRGFLSSPAVDLSELGLAPPKKEPKTPLPTMPYSELLTRAHTVLMASQRKANLLNDVKQRYMNLLQEAKAEGYLPGTLPRISTRSQGKSESNELLDWDFED